MYFLLIQIIFFKWAYNVHNSANARNSKLILHLVILACETHMYMNASSEE